MWKQRLWVVGVLVCWWLTSGVAVAAGLLTTSQAGASGLSPVRSVELSIEVNGSTATVEERRTYLLGAGSFDVAENSITLYRSLPADASVEGVEIDVDGETSLLDGRVLGAAQADELRRELVLELHDPAPLREMGQRMFVSDALIVSGGATLTVRLHSSTSLVPRGTLQALSIPLEWHADDVPQVAVDLRVTTTEPLRALYAPYHELVTVRDGEHHAVATYSGSDVCSRFDVTLMLSSGSEDVRLDLLPFRASDSYLAREASYAEGEAGYVLGLLTPTAVLTEQPERDIVVAFDVSGSMEGEKLEQAKLALEHVLAGLGVADTLSLITFSGDVTLLGQEGQSVTENSKRALLNRIAELIAEGGTNIGAALERAFAALDGIETNQARARTVVLLTDGVPTEGITDIDAIADLALSKNLTASRVFTFGLGADVNTLLLDRLAKDSGGRATYVRQDTVADAVHGFFASIAAPVLTHPAIADADGVLSDVFPEVLPDLYAGRTQTFVARYQPGTHVLGVEGDGASGQVRRDYEITLPDYAMADGSVARLWAQRQVAQWLERLKIVGSKPDLERDVSSLARRFGVVTAFTRFDTDEEGQAKFVFSEVPTDAVGAVAVDTSASIGGYGSSETSERTLDATVRYYLDRNFPTASGYRTDAVLGPDASDLADDEWISLHFGSERYFEVLSAQSDPHFGGFLSVGPDVRFVHAGRSFQVTDPARVDSEHLPRESDSIPRGESTSRNVETKAQLLEASDVEDASPTLAETDGGSVHASTVPTLATTDGGSIDRDGGVRIDSGERSQVRREPTFATVQTRHGNCAVGGLSNGCAQYWLFALSLAWLRRSRASRFEPPGARR